MRVLEPVLRAWGRLSFHRLTPFRATGQVWHVVCWEGRTHSPCSLWTQVVAVWKCSRQFLLSIFIHFHSTCYPAWQHVLEMFATDRLDRSSKTYINISSAFWMSRFKCWKRTRHIFFLLFFFWGSGDRWWGEFPLKHLWGSLGGTDA